MHEAQKVSTAKAFVKSAKNQIVFFATIVGAVPIIIGYYQYLRISTLEGSWKVTCHIQSSSLKRYIGKSTGYKIFFAQDGDQVSGQGEMWWIDDKEIPFKQHVPLTLSGKVDGDLIRLTYSQEGAIRTTVGEIVLKEMQDGRFEGTFAGTAADSKGIAVAEQIY
jgi:hypothetical protein